MESNTGFTSRGSWDGRRSAPPLRTTTTTPGGFSLVEGNIRSSSARPSQVSKRMRNKVLTIDEAPMMLLPKARVHDNVDFFTQYKRSYGVVADTEVQGLHISTLQPVDSMLLRPATRSALKSNTSRRSSIAMTTKSEADSGIGSLKRSVTFENLSNSRSTLFRSDDEWSNISVEDKENNNSLCYFDVNRTGDTGSLTVRLPRLGLDGVKDDGLDGAPDHLDTFGDNTPILASSAVKPRSILVKRVSYPRASSKSKRMRHGGVACEICGMDISDQRKVTKEFGSTDTFATWIKSKWGKDLSSIDFQRKELQFIPSPSFIFRGRVPHFCNFVRSLPLHSKADLDTTDLLEDSELGDEVDLVAESAEGSQIGQWRKGSGDSENDNDVEAWLLEKRARHHLLSKLISSIPEQKEDGVTSGFEGRPASPSSQGDQDNADLGGLTEEDEDEKMTSSPVTGVEIVTGKRKYVVYRFKLAAPDSNMTIPEVVTPPPPELPSDAWGMSNKHLSDTLIPSGQSTDDNGERSDSPRQPPPTPEPKPPETPPPSKRRACVSKKTKKPIERLRKKKEMEVPPEIQSPVVVETEPTTPAEDESAKKDFKIELKVPDLPPPQEKKERHLSAQSKVKKHLIQAETDLDLQNQDASDQSDSQLNSYQDYDLSGMETNGLDDIKQPPQIKSWIKGRLALSQQSSRFELPMDMKRLETMTPQEYIKAYCIITSRRQNLYQKIFFKNKDKSATILFKDIEKTLKDVLVNTITSDQVEDVLQLLEVTEQTKIDYKLFSGMAAYSERVLYPKFVTEDTHDMPEYQREKIECADFSALDWKFHGINVNPAILKMLRRIS